ncbi:Calcineurin-like phosphoesterase [Phytophthora infestans]|uniref:Serine/threonine-protein phosphatase n=1 Tax=Phytophthora infestans TaxID=4787 RepID=A0A833S9P6_PHYIN|nr:Calcineurin-like phosphoesterase [Phytophthora infestans]
MHAGIGLRALDKEELENNYYGEQKLMEGALIKLGDYAHYRYFQLFRSGRLCYYELPAPAVTAGGVRRIHLTSKHQRGIMMLHAPTQAKDLGKNDEEYEDDLLKCGLVFNRKKLEMQLTGYSPSGQILSWKLRASRDCVYLKWERAFRLALRPIWVPNSNHCMVCKKDFTFFTRPHHCRDCSPISIPISSLKQGTRVLVYGILIGRVVQVSLSEGIELVSVELEKQSSDVRSFALHYVQLYSDAVLSANRIKNAIRQHLAYLVYRTRLNFSTWNMLEAMQEQRTMQMMRFVKKSMSINELHSMMPLLGRRNTLDGVVLEKERVKASLTHYRGVRVLFPLRLITVKRLINQFRNGILLHPVFVCRILDEVEKLFLTQHESPMNAIDIPPGVRMVVVGDLHGQLEDLLTIMEKNGAPSSKTWYLFNGDFVDRGAHGVEIMLLLLAFKLMYPAFVFLNRGNHEERMINEIFGF